MDYNKVGNAISYLRKRAGYTQKELADRIGISDKAVSKWERGITLPDVSCLTKLSILLDTDTDSLLSGDIINHESGWVGVLILNNKSEIKASTVIYDKPLIYYLLSYFLLVGIRKVVVISSDDEKIYLRQTFGCGESFGIELVYSDEKIDSKELLGFTNVMVVFGKSFIYGVDQTRFFQRAMAHRDRTTILSLPRRKNDGRSGIRFDNNKQIVDIDNTDFVVTQYDYYTIPVAFCPSGTFFGIYDNGKISFNGLDVLYTEVLDRGYLEMELDTWDDVTVAAQLIKIVQENCGMELYCLEEIAWRRGFINTGLLQEMSEKKKGTKYGQYLLSLSEQ